MGNKRTKHISVLSMLLKRKYKKTNGIKLCMVSSLVQTHLYVIQECPMKKPHVKKKCVHCRILIILQFYDIKSHFLNMLCNVCVSQVSKNCRYELTFIFSLTYTHTQIVCAHVSAFMSRKSVFFSMSNWETLQQALKWMMWNKWKKQDTRIYTHTHIRTLSKSALTAAIEQKWQWPVFPTTSTTVIDP